MLYLNKVRHGVFPRKEVIFCFFSVRLACQIHASELLSTFFQKQVYLTLAFISYGSITDFGATTEHPSLITYISFFSASHEFTLLHMHSLA